MAEGLVLRGAKEADREFLIEAIIEAEKSGSEAISYCEIFSLSEVELHTLLDAVLQEDFAGQELCTSGFLIAEIDGEYAGAACAWLEGEAGLPSTLIKANLLQHFLDKERLRLARPFLVRLEALAIAREAGAAELESIYVRPAYRGQGITGCLLEEHLSLLRRRMPALAKAQIILVKGNDRACRAYEKLGFGVALERHTDDPLLHSIVPGGTKILMEKPISKDREAPTEARRT